MMPRWSAAADLQGKVVLIDFCTYTCINRLRTLPYVRAWAGKYKAHGLVLIGVHSPEFLFEQGENFAEARRIDVEQSGRIRTERRA
jgi:thiol-disulfide isomerase/thioredoxin